MQRIQNEFPQNEVGKMGKVLPEGLVSPFIALTIIMMTVTLVMAFQ